MFLSEINIYPVKSLGGISLESSLIEERGLQFDRRWLLIDEKNRFLTQREYPKMATIEVNLSANSLRFSNHSKTLEVPFTPDSGQTASAKVWNSRVKSNVYDDRTNEWFSEVLNLNCRLVVMPEDAKRKVSPFYAVRKFKDTVSYADAYPFLIIGQSSLDDLNSRFEKTLPMNRFRTNFVVSDAEAFAEDKWKSIKIGAEVFHVVKPCARCVMTTIDQTSGEKDGKEPLKTLSKYRAVNGKVLFGQNLIAEKPDAILKVGDKIEVLETK